MPTYNYYCKNCDAYCSYFQKMSDKAKSICENCNGKIDRVITGGTGLIFKGSGFYLTDYKEKNNKVALQESNGSKKNESKKTDKLKSKSDLTQKTKQKKEKR